MVRFLITLLVPVALTSCDVTDPVLLEEARIGVIRGLERSPVTIPDSVGVRLEFSVVVWTVGNSCVRLGETEVDRGNDLTRITPYDFFVTGEKGGVCADVGLFFLHHVLLGFDQVGDHRVVVIGRRNEKSDETFELEYFVRAY